MKHYKIEGIDCQSCATLIKLSLDDAGFNSAEVDYEKRLLLLPPELESKLDKIKQAVDSAGHYKLVI
jgi:copper chaperone CopZ